MKRALTVSAVFAVGAIVIALSTGTPRPPPDRRPAPKPLAVPLASGWCGRTESAVDRPDAVAGSQVHVIYAFTADSENRFDAWAPRLVRDVAAADRWWREQDADRALRFDLASFPDCDSTFGRLDITSVALRTPAQTSIFGRDGSGAELVQALDDDFVRTGKIYLMFVDGDSSERRYCGTDFGPIALVFLQNRLLCPTRATLAVHELMHALGAVHGTSSRPPHACRDGGHVCDDNDDILARGQRGPLFLLQAKLDSGRDDYYGHSGPWFDVRKSPFLLHLDEPQVRLTLTVPNGGGSIESAVPGLSCPPSCAGDFDLGARVELDAVADDGYGFVEWGGVCGASVVRSSTCIVRMDQVNDVAVTFSQLRALRVLVEGTGRVLSTGFACVTQCSWRIPVGQSVTVDASPGMGSRFVRWEGACSGTSTRCTFVAQPDSTLRAVFVPTPGS